MSYNFLDKDSNTVGPVDFNLTLGRKDAANSRSFNLSNEDYTQLSGILTKLNASIAVTGTFWQATQPVSLASLPLPTGAATEASLAKLTITQGATTSGQTGALVQGSVTTAAPSYTTGQVAPLSLDPSGQLRITGTVTAGGLNQGSTTSGQQGSLQMGAVTTAAPTYTNGQTNPLSLTTGGLLRVDGSGVTQPVSGTFWQATQPVSLASLPALVAGTALIGKVGLDQTTPGTTNAVSVAHIAGTAVASGNGVVGAGVQRVAIASDNTAFSVNAVQSGTWNIGTVTPGTGATNLGKAEDAAHASGDTGVMALAVRKDTATALAGTDADYIPLITDASGQLWCNIGTPAIIGAVGDTAWASGNGNVIQLLKTIATAALDTTTASPVKIDQTTDGTTNKVAVGNSPAGNTAKTYTGSFVVAATALTRPANTTAYSANDSISNNATAASVTANSVSLSDTNDHPIDLAEILLASTDTGPGTAGARIRIHLFNSDPTASSGVVGGDNAAWSNKQAGWLGSFTATMKLFSDGSRGVAVADEGTLRMTAPTSGAKTIYWQLQTLDAFTPSASSTTFTPTFKGFQARAA